MNYLIKALVFAWLLLCAIGVYLGSAMLGFILAFTSLSFMYDVMPFVTLTSFVLLFNFGKQTYKLNPKQKIAQFFGFV